ncbi:DUF397 domain-containing protein [Streptomyces sp. NPDC090052]|uniref:DUF397 domain-containing protein n=1 Tax=unclassified Streptomyces TaxID=2593676 RepID=UPI00225B4CF6|nr:MULTISPECIES: DUF397 domain-containing protein [unclassified Streptomyces]MCX4725942.1 DUF397 domain-containing protein [Streptomyces sp. NBC_01306]WSX42787.1 DUF397 domain-containing protein [Streptomyces sp. NBC_00963]
MNRTPDLSTAHWRKSSYSDGGQTNCVEVAHDFPGLIPVRDSKAAPAGPALVFPVAAWTAFIHNVRGQSS